MILSQRHCPVKDRGRGEGGGESKWILKDEEANIKLNEIIGIIGQLSSKFFEEDLL